MEINLERIKNRFDGKITYGDITEIGISIRNTFNYTF